MEQPPRALSADLIAANGRETGRLVERALQEFAAQLPQSFDPPLTADEIAILGPALALFDRSSTPFLFPVDGHGIMLSRATHDALSELLNRTDCEAIRAIEVRGPVQMGSGPAVQVSRLLRADFSSHGADSERVPSQPALEIFLRAHPAAAHEESFQQFLQAIPSEVMGSLTTQQQADLLEMAYLAQHTDALQLRIQPSDHSGSLQIMIFGAGKALPFAGWASSLVKVLERHGLQLHRLAQTPPVVDQKGVRVFYAVAHANPVIWQGHEASAREEALARDLRLVGVFSEQDRIQSLLVDTGRIRADLAAIVRAMVRFTHQGLLYYDAFEFNLANCEDAFCAHPDVVETLLQAFEKRFHPLDFSDSDYKTLLAQAHELIEALSTGHEGTDRRRRLVLQQGLSFVEHVLKTTFYAATPGLAFRLDPAYLERLPSVVLEKFPEVPFGIFLLFTSQAIGFHIRFRDLARGGLRTVIPHQVEQLVIERNQIFQEGYNLAYTQQKKNKDIPEGGAKGILLLNPFEAALKDRDLFEWNLSKQTLSDEDKAKKRAEWSAAARQQGLYQAQRQYIEALLALVNCDDQGKLRNTRIRDLYGKPEYLYVGPDENMHNQMLVWIAETAKRVQYRPGSAFISSKPKVGINHKEYGVTSLGVHVYVTEVLRYLGLDPAKDRYSVKMSGGPDGDVAGNEMVNLYKTAPQTCAFLSTIDGSGTILDPVGLDLQELDRLFHLAEPIRQYPMDQLHEGGLFIDSRMTRDQPHGPPLMLCKRKQGTKVAEDWIPQSEAFSLLRSTMFQTQADLFIPAGGRPRTLNETNIEEFCLAGGEPSVRAIVEGANLFLTPKARRYLEERGVLIIKDSSANKGGVICSSFEVLLGLTLSEQEFLDLKPQLMPEVLNLIRQKALDEAQILLRTHEETGQYLTDLSDLVSDRINHYKDQLLRYFAGMDLQLSPDSPLARILLSYCPRTLRERFADRVLQQLPQTHQKAILACQIASQTVYRRGLDWSPSIVDVMPLVIADLTGGA
jgi:glutamate dehydrogenase